MDKKLDTLDMLCDTMYRMFKTGSLPYLDMEDYIAMWRSLAEHWQVYISDNEWEEFTEEINCVASNREGIFKEIFDKYFNN